MMASNYGLGAAEATRQTEVASQLEQLMRVVDEAHNSARSLCERLGTVQRPESPPNVSGGAVPTEVLCPLADQIRGVRHTVESLCMLLDSNRGRLEI